MIMIRSTTSTHHTRTRHATRLLLLTFFIYHVNQSLSLSSSSSRSASRQSRFLFLHSFTSSYYKTSTRSSKRIDNNSFISIMMMKSSNNDNHNNNNDNDNNNMNKKKTEIYNIPGSGWKSPTWNWGYAVGTGHDCAMICRKKYDSFQKRKDLILSLLEPTTPLDTKSHHDDGNDVGDDDTSIRDPPFEEVKLILGLTIQRGRWDGTDGGRVGGYSEVLQLMAQAQRYESNDEELNAKLLVKDMSDRFHLIAGNMFDDDNISISIMRDGFTSSSNSQSECQDMMQQIIREYSHDMDMVRRKCTGLVLLKMGFVTLGC